MLQIRGFVDVLSPIVHSEILSMDVSPKEGAAKATRALSFIVKNEDGFTKKKLAVVSGNSVRGVGRRLLYDLTEKTLGYTMGDILNPKDARNLLYSFRCGGQTAKGTKPKKTTAEAYHQAQEVNPFLNLLGMVFNGHHFEGNGRIGFLVPYLQETCSFYYKLLPQPLQEKHDPAALMSADEFIVSCMNEIRYTRRMETGGLVIEEEKAVKVDKEAAIFGVEYIPAGTILATHDVCMSEDKGTQLAFKAMFGLLMQNGVVGGMTAKGHGMVEFNLYIKEGERDEPLQPQQVIQEYIDFLKENREAIVTSIQAFPAIFAMEKEKSKDKDNE